MPATLAPGKICYLEIPALDVERSVGFYETVFGWTIRRRNDGEVKFDDTVGEVSGTWVTGRAGVVGTGSRRLRAGRERGADTERDPRGGRRGRDAAHAAG